jgi:hypothetical protein
MDIRSSSSVNAVLPSICQSSSKIIATSAEDGARPPRSRQAVIGATSTRVVAWRVVVERLKRAMVSWVWSQEGMEDEEDEEDEGGGTGPQ